MPSLPLYSEESGKRIAGNVPQSLDRLGLASARKSQTPPH